jgi:hypothetical protein
MRNPWQVEQKAKIMAAEQSDDAMIFAFCSTCEVLQRRQQRSFVENDEEPLSNSRIILSSHVRSIMRYRSMRVHRVRVSGVGVHEPTRSRLVQKANNFIRRRFPTRNTPKPLQLQRCSVTLLHPKGGNTKRDRRPQVYIRFPYRCLQGESTVGLLGRNP